MCSGSEAGSYLRLIDFVYHSTLGLRVIKKKHKGLFVADVGQTGIWDHISGLETQRFADIFLDVPVLILDATV